MRPDKKSVTDGRKRLRTDGHRQPPPPPPAQNISAENNRKWPTLKLTCFPNVSNIGQLWNYITEQLFM